jgi:hypothetical protein
MFCKKKAKTLSFYPKCLDTMAKIHRRVAANIRQLFLKGKEGREFFL